MRIKDGSICIFDLKCELIKVLNRKMENCIFDIKRINNYNRILSKYNYKIVIIENNERSAFTVEGFASSFNCEQILNKFPFNI